MFAPELGLSLSEAMGTPGSGCLRMRESMLVALGAHARIRLEHARQRRPRGANPRYWEKLIFPARALPIIAPAAVRQGAVAAHALHRRPGLGLELHGRRRLRGAQCSLTRGWGAGGGLYHSPPGGDPPPLSPPMARARGLRGPGPEGSPPLHACPAGARLRQLDCLFIYFRCVLHVAMATAPSFPASVEHRWF